ncbi:MAG TPA: redoxin domain-containing protein [Acidimicrobiia bacterium]|nr:redoxin domain-containing protein [Acidimicrobiia bacterium]
MAQRHDEFLERGGRVFAVSADSPGQNSAVVEKLALPFPILSDPDRSQAITPLGFADDEDPRQISLPAAVVIDPDGEEAYRFVGRDFADRPDEGDLLAALEGLGLEATNQDPPARGPAQPGEAALNIRVLEPYFKGGLHAAYALRRRHRPLEEFADDAKAMMRMLDRYLKALAAVEKRRS